MRNIQDSYNKTTISSQTLTSLSTFRIIFLGSVTIMQRRCIVFFFFPKLFSNWEEGAIQ